jgi:hypothetical protein
MIFLPGTLLPGFFALLAGDASSMAVHCQRFFHPHERAAAGDVDRGIDPLLDPRQQAAEGFGGPVTAHVITTLRLAPATVAPPQ